MTIMVVIVVTTVIMMRAAAVIMMAVLMTTPTTPLIKVMASTAMAAIAMSRLTVRQMLQLPKSSLQTILAQTV